MPVSQLLEDVIDPHRGTGVAIHSTQSGTGAEPVGTRNAAIRYGLGNLLENAVDFAGARVDVSANWDDTSLTITIRDDGPGFSLDILGKIGDPYVSVRGARTPQGSTGGGLGLGIFIAKTLLERTGAKLILDNQPPPDNGLKSVSVGRARFLNPMTEWTKRHFRPIREITDSRCGL